MKRREERERKRKRKRKRRGKRKKENENKNENDNAIRIKFTILLTQSLLPKAHCLLYSHRQLVRQHLETLVGRKI